MRWLILTALLGLVTPILADEGAAPSRLRVLCYNIHHGEGADGKLDLERIAGIIKEARPDLVFLQEMDHRTTRTKMVDQTAELVRLTGMQGQFGKAIDFGGGGYGLAILARVPLEGVKTHKLPGKENQETRIVMEARVEPGKGLPTLTLLNTHFQHDDPQTRKEQATRIEELFGKAPGTFLLAGDMNAAPGSPPIQLLAKSWAFATPPGGPGLLTVPSDRPRVQIDYILFRPRDSFRVVEARVLEEPVASDHRPVFAVLEWTGK